MKTLRHNVPMLLELSVVVLALAACGSSSSSSSRSSNGKGARGAGKPMSVATQEDWALLPLYVALDQGFMQKHGIPNVSVVNVSTAAAMTAAVNRGDVDMGFQTPLLLQAFNKVTGGPKLKFFAPGNAASESWVASTKSGIPVATSANWKATVRAWRGKTIGVPVLGAAIQAFTAYLAKAAGLAPGDYHLVATGAGPPQLAALKAGVADVIGNDGFAATEIAASGAGRVVINFASGQGPSLFRHDVLAAFFAPVNRLQQDRPRFAAFLAAIEQALSFMKVPGNAASVQATMVKDLKVTPAIAKSLYDNELDNFFVNISPATMTRSFNDYVKTGVMPGPAPSYSDLVFNVNGP